MKIDSAIFTKANIVDTNNIENKLNEGQVVEGKIIYLNENLVSIKLSSGQVVHGNNISLHNFTEGQLLDFLVKSIDSSEIILVPKLSNEHNTVEKANNLNYIKSLLLNINISPKIENISIVEYLMKFNMSLDNKTILEAIRAVEMVKKDIVNKDEGKHITPSTDNDTKAPIGNSIGKVETDRNFIKKVQLDKSLLEKSTINSKIIDNITEKVTTNVTSDKDLIDKSLLLNNSLKEEINLNSSSITGTKLTTEKQTNYSHETITTNDDLIKKVVFLMKSKISVSNKNLDLLNHLLSGKDFLLRDLNDMFKIISSENLNAKYEKQLSKLMAGVNVELNTEIDKITLQNYYENLSKVLSNIHRDLGSKVESNNYREFFNMLIEKLDFLEKLNQNLTFLYIPFALKDDELSKGIYILKRPKKERESNKIRLCINVNTVNFDEIRVFCDVYKSSMNIRINLQDDYSEKIFNQQKNRLEESLKQSGFQPVFIDIMTDYHENPLDFFAQESAENYLLDIRV